MWVINEAKNAGVDFDFKLIKAKGWNKVTNPIVHDSVNDIPGEAFDPSRKFLWTEATSGTSQFDSKSHLKLNWEDTLKFQSKGQRKFQVYRIEP